MKSRTVKKLSTIFLLSLLVLVACESNENGTESKNDDIELSIEANDDVGYTNTDPEHLIAFSGYLTNLSNSLFIGEGEWLPGGGDELDWYYFAFGGPISHLFNGICVSVIEFMATGTRTITRVPIGR